ncbi:hypothetical protein V8C86DRAFT_2821056 [Haematococcus lacustris]
MHLCGRDSLHHGCCALAQPLGRLPANPLLGTPQREWLRSALLPQTQPLLPEDDFVCNGVLPMLPTIVVAAVTAMAVVTLAMAMVMVVVAAVMEIMVVAVAMVVFEVFVIAVLWRPCGE